MLQLQDVVHDLNLEVSHLPELLANNLSVLEQRLSPFEYDRHVGFITLPASWFVNCYRTVALMKSVQGRVLSGLGFSLALSGVIFIICMVPLTLVSGYASRSEDGIRKVLAEKQKVFTEEVTDLLKLERERSSLQSEITTINEQMTVESTIEREQKEISPEDRSLSDQQAQLIENQAKKEGEIQETKADIAAKLKEIDSLYFILSNESGLAAAQTSASFLVKPDNSLGETTIEAKNDSKTLTSLANFITDQGLLNHSRRILLAAFAGAIGSMMSILIRLDQMDKENIKNPFLLGALKPLIGAVFGISVFAILSTRVIDILPSSFYLYDSQISTARGETGPVTSLGELRSDPLGDLDSQELYKIFLVAFLAGFSERLANDTLKSVGSSRSLG